LRHTLRASPFTGKKYPLRLYRHIVQIHRREALMLALMLLGLWVLNLTPFVVWMPVNGERWLLAGGLVATAYWLFITVGPLTAYAQPLSTHLRVQTPIYRLKISYQRIRSVRPIDVSRSVTPAMLTARQRKELAPFLGKTVLGIDLREWPLPRWLLRLFLSRWMLANDQQGLVLYVEDWMGLSNQLTQALQSWHELRRPQQPGRGVAAEILEQGSKRRRRF
jgi:hypothetical protein